MAPEAHVARGTPGARPAPRPVEIDDVQGLLADDWRSLPEATFLFLRAAQPRAAQGWLTWIASRTVYGDATPTGQAVNVAFTHAGLEALGLEGRALDGFSQPFHEGMDGAARRVRLLGDHGEGAPEKWGWGNETNPVHVLVLLYAVDATTLVDLRAEHEKRATAGGLEVVAALSGASFRAPFREPFGFADGISQPPIVGIDPAPVSERPVATGEFLLGYRNELGRYPASPSVTADDDTAAVGLAPAVSGSRRDFGRNGSYLVFRQLEQDVLAFWRLAAAQAKATSIESVEKWGAKMIGRWTSGAPLALCPDGDDQQFSKRNDFGYRLEDDDRGLRCPPGAHIRRTNPRDGLPRTDTYRSLEVVRQHRILRRGRAYGRPLQGWPVPEDMLRHGDSSKDRGLCFVCLNADLAQQFEFIQERWVSDPTFVSAKSGELDPVIGNPRGVATFTVPADPVPICIGDPGTPLSRFVTVRGGAYFFLPSKRALGYLALVAGRR